MQASVNKYVIFFGLLACFLGKNGPVLGQLSELNLADSLFTIGKYSEAQNIYEKYFENIKKYNPNLLLKLSFLAEKSNDPAKCLYYLSILTQKTPTIKLLEKMSQVASEYNLEGYNFNDFSYFLVFYRRYGGYIPILLLTLGLYVVVVMFLKVKSGDFIQRRHKWAVVIYLMALFGLLNIPNNYQTGVVKKEETYVRSFPSSASPVVQKIKKGNKLTIIGNRDEWNRVIWNGEIVFVRKDDLWII
jgi:hypothetical protein